jgi:hypothetical protein
MLADMADVEELHVQLTSNPFLPIRLSAEDAGVASDGW